MAGSIQSDDPAAVAAAVLTLVREARLAAGDAGWLDALALPDSEGEWASAGSLLLPGSALAAVLEPDALGVVDREWLDRWVYARSAVDRALDVVGLRDAADTLPGELSQGQRKLAGVARALACGPRMVLLDEPAAGLDGTETLALGRRLRDVIDDGVTILLVDHDMGLVLGTCDRIVVLDFGRVLAEGTPDQIRRDDRVVAAYLGDDVEIPSEGTST